MRPRDELSVDEIRLGDPAFWALSPEVRDGAFRTLRRERAVSFHQELDDRLFPPGPGFWALTRNADILHAATHAKEFCSGRGATSIADIPSEFLEFFGSLVNTDAPKHGRLRRLVSTAFTERMLARLERDVQRAAQAVVDAVADKGECDFVTAIAAPFPIRIICQMMGIPESQHSFVFDQTSKILGLGDPEYTHEATDLALQLMGAGAALAELMNDLRRQRLEAPTDDLTSVVAHAQIDGDRLTEPEMASFFIALVTAGNETTRNAISHGMKALTDFPDQRRAWAADFERLARTAVEEIVRWATPLIFIRRTATCDTEIGGQPIREGEKVLLFYCSGNRDEAAFEDPYRFDVRRDPNPHVGFGAGPHFCLGANLARREITVMFRELFRRLPDIEVSGEPARLASAFINGVKHMPCRFTPRR